VGSTDKFKDLIRQFVCERLARERGVTETVSDQDSLIELGIIDSMGIVQLLGHLESSLKIKIPDEDIVPDNFDSIESLAAYLDRPR
jgi:acyl carrier protein